MLDSIPAVDSGNYYFSGAKRVLAKLAQLGIEVPDSALQYPEYSTEFKPWFQYTNIEQAMMDWFAGRDYVQAQALIHFKPFENEWHAIYARADEDLRGELSQNTLCPTLLDAIGAVINGCDRELAAINDIRKERGEYVITWGGGHEIRIKPIIIESFDQQIRDRVRQAFKGVRYGSPASLAENASKLPGFKNVPVQMYPSANYNRGHMYLGFPRNWSLAMRNALKQLGIDVALNQSQELAAVFLGASNWHQLTKYQQVPNAGSWPVAVDLVSGNGTQSRYYHTTEEALFATGEILKHFDEPVVITELGLGLSLERTLVSIATEIEWKKQEEDIYYFPRSSVLCGYNDYLSLEELADGVEAAARDLLKKVRGDNKDEASRLLYGDSDVNNMIAGIYARYGVPLEQIVHLGDHVCVVRYVMSPDYVDMQAAYLQILKLYESGPVKIKGGDVLMYKAEVRLHDLNDGKVLVIAGNYGNDEPVRIPVSSHQEVKPLFDLLYKEGLFCLMPQPRQE